MRKIFYVFVIVSFIFSSSMPAFAANGTWLNTGNTSASWINANNWSGGVVPGATAGTVNTDVATFNTALGTYGAVGTPLIIDANRNIGGIAFDTAAGNYFIGSTGLNPLLLTSGGTIQILGSLTATNAIETINAPLVLEGAAGTYTFSNNSANGSGAGAGTLNIGGGITGGAAGATVLTINGSNTNLNIISGLIANGSATSVAVTKSGSGTWELSGTNTYTGGTILNAGTLIAANTQALGGATSALSIAGGTVDLATNSSITAYNTTVTGSATIDSDLATSGVGITQTLGTLNIGADTLTVAAGSSVSSGVAGLTFGAVTLTASGAVFTANSNTLLTLGSVGGSGNNFTVNGSGNTNVTGIIGTGAGSVTKAGSGTLTLSNANTYTGGTTLNAGILNLGSAGAIGSSGTITLGGGTLQYSANNDTDYSSRFSAGINQAYDIDTNGQNVTFASALTSNGGTLTKLGSGVLTLNADNTYTGLTTINAGTLQVGNDSAVGTGALTNNATLALGLTDLSLGNSYTQNSSSNLNLTANSSSKFGNIASIGHAATVSGGSVVNVTVGGYIPNNAILDIVNTGGTGVTGAAPGTVNTSETGTPGYTPRVSFTSSILNGNLVLNANHSSTGFASLANNSNTAALGNALDNETNPGADLTNVLNTLEFSSNAQVTAALNTLGPVVDRSVIDTSMSSLNNFIGASLERAKNVLSGNSDSTGVSSGDENPLNSLWAKQYGGYISQGTREGIAGYNAWNTGTAVGLDHMFTDNLTLGASLGYAYGNVHSDQNSATAYSNSAEATLYAAYQGQNHPYFVDLAGSFANNWYDGQRSINIDNTINRTADSQYQGQQSGVYLDGGYKFDVGHSVQLTPLASLRWTHLALGSYTETNAGDLNLMVNRQSYNILESGLGASVSYEQKFGWGNVTPEFHAKWLYDFIDNDMVVTSAFTGGGASFTSTGATPAKDAVDVGGSLTFDFKNDISLIGGLDTEVRDNFIAVYGSVALRYKF